MTDKMVVAGQGHGQMVRDESRAFEASDLASAVQISALVADSKLFKGVSTAAAAFVVLATGRELGLSAMQSLRGIHMIDGKPSLSSDVCIAVVMHSPACLFFRLIESTAQIATYETQRRGDAVRRMSFSIQDAHAAGLAGKDNWRKFPAAMLRARAAMALARAIYPDALMGVYDPDECAGGAPATELVDTIVETPASTTAPTTAPAIDVSADVEAALVARIAKAKDIAGLSRVGVAVQKATLEPEAVARLRAAYVARKAALGQPQPVAAPVAPAAPAAPVGPADDENDAAEIEGEAYASQHDS